MLDFDTIFEKTGELGRYQLLMVFLLCLPACFMNSACQFSWVFLFYTPPHKCHVTPELLHNFSQSGLSLEIGECSIKMYQNESSEITGIKFLDEIPCPEGWDYDRSQFKESLTTRWDLVCDRAIQPKTVIAVAGVVTIFGCIFLSWFQDRFGRKMCFYVCVLVYTCGASIPLLMPNLLTYAILRSLADFTAITSFDVSYVWAVEMVGPSKRTLVSTTLCVMYSVASVSLAATAYIFNTWLQFGLATTVPFLALLSFHWLVVESPRWLVSVGRFEDAKRNLKRIINRNGKDIDEKVLNSFISTDQNSKTTYKREKRTVLDLMRGRELRLKTILITIVWLGNALLYFSIAFNVENISDNFYIMYTLQAAMEAPAVLINLIYLNRIGRIWPLFTGMFVSGICCLLTAVSTFPDMLIMFLALLAKFGICVSYIIIYQVASELYPTVVRGLGNGVCSVFGEGAKVLMPYILYTATYNRSLPMIILGCLVLIGSLMSLFLPETLGLHMAETLEEGETHGKAGLPALRSHIARAKRGCRCVKQKLDASEVNGNCVEVEESLLEKVEAQNRI